MQRNKYSNHEDRNKGLNLPNPVFSRSNVIMAKLGPNVIVKKAHSFTLFNVNLVIIDKIHLAHILKTGRDDFFMISRCERSI